MSARHKTIYLIRHGETQSNVESIFQGGDEALTARGRGQAMSLALHLVKKREQYPIALLINSDYVRARETVNPIAHALRIPSWSSPLFVERKHPSVIHGKHTSDPDAYAIWLRGRENFHDPKFDYADGETFKDLKSRAITALKLILDCEETHIGVVTHGVFATALVAASQRGKALTSRDLNRYQFRMDNTGLSILTHETHKDFSDEVTGWVIQKWNDTSHLD